MRVTLIIAAATLLVLPCGTAQNPSHVRPRPVAPEPDTVQSPDNPTLGCRTAQPGDEIDDFVVRLPSPAEPKAVVSFRLSRPKDEAFDPAKDTPTLLLVGNAVPFADDPLRYTMHLTLPAEVSNGRYYGENLLFISYANGVSPSPGDVEFAPKGIELHSLCVEVQNSSYRVPPPA